MKAELWRVIDQIGREKNIDKQILIETVKSAILSAYRKRLDYSFDNLEVILSEETGKVELCILKKVVAEVVDENTEVNLEEAKKIDPEANISSWVKIPYTPGNFGRITAQIAKQVIIQRVREAEKDALYQEFKGKEGKLISGKVLREERNGDLIIDLEKTEAFLPRREQLFREFLRKGEKIKLYVLEVKKTGRWLQIIVSRTHPGLLIKLFEAEVPEIQEGILEIKNAVRESSGRSKIAVHSKNKDIDAVGSCVGIRGTRVQAVVSELKGEKIDIIEWSDDPVTFVNNALSPAKISKIKLNREENHMQIVVPDDQLSLAIGKKGQNVRLAAKLTRWQIDIKSESSQAEEEKKAEEKKGEEETIKHEENKKEVEEDKNNTNEQQQLGLSASETQESNSNK